MRISLFALLLGVICFGCGEAEVPAQPVVTDDVNLPMDVEDDEVMLYIDEVMAHRLEEFQDFKDTAKSPLATEDIESFNGLDYFEPDPDYRVTAVLNRFENPDTVLFETSTDRMPEYLVYGTLQFTLKDTLCALTIYQQVALMDDPVWGNILFLPFTDATTGVTSYGAGRYLEPEIPEGDSMEIDFNYAFNPYCAYADRWSCPIPPKANDLQVTVAAGVKAWDHH